MRPFLSQFVARHRGAQLRSMGKVAFVFPGQGTQYVGMGMELAKAYPVAAAVYEEANEIMGLDLRKLCAAGPEAELLKTEISQPTIHATSIAILRLVESFGLTSDVTAGFSLGEYAALVHAGTLRFEDTLKVVRQRGIFMQNAVPMGLGKMAWVTGLGRESVETIVREVPREHGVIECSNFNCPRQIIVSGHAAAVESAVAQANRQGATTTFLNVSGPFHTSLLRDAGKQLHDALLEVPMATPQKPVVSNVTASYLTEDDDIRQLLDEHVYKPVRWEESVNTMLEDGVDTFVEIGPKHLLTSFNRATAEERGIEARCLNVEDTATLEVLLKEMETA